MQNDLYIQNSDHLARQTSQHSIFFCGAEHENIPISTVQMKISITYAARGILSQVLVMISGNQVEMICACSDKSEGHSLPITIQDAIKAEMCSIVYVILYKMHVTSTTVGNCGFLSAVCLSYFSYFMYNTCISHLNEISLFAVKKKYMICESSLK